MDSVALCAQEIDFVPNLLVEIKNCTVVGKVLHNNNQSYNLIGPYHILGISSKV